MQRSLFTISQMEDDCQASMRRSARRRLSAAQARSRRRRLILICTVALTAALMGIPKALQPLINSASAAETRASHKPAKPTPRLKLKSLSTKGVYFIASFEGFFPNLYNDPVGHCTIGYGTLLHLGPCTATDQASWGTLTKAGAIKLLRKETDRIDLAVRKMVKVPLNQAQHDVLVSFAYNVGIQALTDSTLLRLLNQGKRVAAADQLLRWNNAGGQEFAGLTRRRVAERKLFLGH